MKPIPVRAHSRTRLKYRPDGLSIFYRRPSDDVEEEMMRIRVIREGKPIDDSLRSSVSSPPETASWTTVPGEAGSWKNKKKKRRIKMRHRRDSKPKPKSKSSKKKKRMTSRSVVPKKAWKLSGREETPVEIDTSSHYILDHLRFLNGKIREKYQIATMCGHVCPTYSPLKSKSFEKITILSDFSRSDSSRSPSPDTPKTALTITSSSSPILTAEAYDAHGVPITPRRNIAPFPDEDPSEKKEKERGVLLAVKDREERKLKEKENKDSKKVPSAEFIKPPVPPVAEFPDSTEIKKEKEKPKSKEKIIKPTRVSSDTKFPGARSPATREKVRLLLKDCALKKRLKEERDSPYDNAALAQSLKNIVKENDERKKKEKEAKMKKKEDEEKKRKEEEEAKKKKREEEEAKKTNESTTASLKTIYSTSVLACESCTACVGCVAYCVAAHPKLPLDEKKKSPESTESTTSSTDPSEKSAKNKSQFF